MTRDSAGISSALLAVGHAYEVHHISGLVSGKQSGREHGVLGDPHQKVQFTPSEVGLATFRQDRQLGTLMICRELW